MSDDKASEQTITRPLPRLNEQDTAAFWAATKEKQFTYELPSTHNSLIYLINGEIKIGKKNHDKVKNSKLILLNKGKSLTVTSLYNSKFLLISGKPINEQIARGGPFVMNTKSEILQAVNDYHNGTFVK